MEMRCLYKKYQCNMHFRICRQSFVLTNPNEKWDLQTHCTVWQNIKEFVLNQIENITKLRKRGKNVSSCEKGIFFRCK